MQGAQGLEDRGQGREVREQNRGRGKRRRGQWQSAEQRAWARGAEGRGKRAGHDDSPGAVGGV